MHVELSRQSVVIKCNLQASIVTGNYEYYYASGLLAQLSNTQLPEDLKPLALHEWVQQTIAGYQPANGQEEHLVHMLRYFHPDEDHFDENMIRLVRMGQSEKNLWKRQ